MGSAILLVCARGAYHQVLAQYEITGWKTVEASKGVWKPQEHSEKIKRLWVVELGKA